MWTCPKCDEQIEDQFDSCWKCAKIGQVSEKTRPQKQADVLNLFFRYWRRGWLILLLVICIGLLERGIIYLLGGPLHQYGNLYLFLALSFALLFLPAAAYWLFVLFFGENAWPWPNEDAVVPPEKKAPLLLTEALKAESLGKVQVALAKYQEIVNDFPGTDFSRDAQISIDSLRAKLR